MFTVRGGKLRRLIRKEPDEMRDRGLSLDVMMYTCMIGGWS